MRTRIDSKNLLPYVGQKVNVTCQVGVCFSITGTLEIHMICWYCIKLPSSEKIGFSYGEFETIGGLLTVHVN